MDTAKIQIEVNAVSALRTAWNLAPHPELAAAMARSSLPSQLLAELPTIAETLAGATTTDEALEAIAENSDLLVARSAVRSLVATTGTGYWNEEEIFEALETAWHDTWRVIATGPAHGLAARLTDAAQAVRTACGTTDTDADRAIRAGVGEQYIAVRDLSGSLVSRYTARRPEAKDVAIFAIVKPTKAPAHGAIYRDPNGNVEVAGNEAGGDAVRAVFAWLKRDDATALIDVAAGNLAGWVLDVTADPAEIARRSEQARLWTTISKARPATVA